MVNANHPTPAPCLPSSATQSAAGNASQRAANSGGVEVAIGITVLQPQALGGLQLLFALRGELGHQGLVIAVKSLVLALMQACISAVTPPELSMQAAKLAEGCAAAGAASVLLAASSAEAHIARVFAAGQRVNRAMDLSRLWF